MTHIPTVEEVVEEFKKICPQFLDFPDAMDIKFADGSNSRKILIDWLTTTLQARDKAHQEALEKAVEETTKECNRQFNQWIEERMPILLQESIDALTPPTDK